MDKKEHDKKIKELEKLSYDESVEYSYIIEELDKLLEENSEDIEALNFKADMLSQLGYKEDAKLIHAKILSLNFSDKEALEEFYYSEYDKYKYMNLIKGCAFFLMFLVFISVVAASVTDTIHDDIVKYPIILMIVLMILIPIVCEVLNRLNAFKNCEQKIPGFTKSYFKNIVAKVDISIAPIVGLVVGFILDRVYSSNNLWYLGICAGMFVGFLYYVWSVISARIADIIKKLKKLRKVRKVRKVRRH